MKHGGIAAAVVLGCLLLGAQWWRPVEAADLPLFRDGERVLMVWDCLPEWFTQAGSQMVAGGRALNPCYAEVLDIQTVRKDGWLIVTDTQSGTVWRVNPARALGFQVLQPTSRAD